jgi:predicted DNA-binding transcriptional regulator AlpA
MIAGATDSSESIPQRELSEKFSDSVSVRMADELKTKRSDPLESLLTRRQTADILGVSTRSVQRLERSGKLRPVRILGRTVRYAASQIRELLT